MALRKLRLEGDKILRITSKTVKKFDERVYELLDDMQETMTENNGVGLAAVQVGVLKRIFIAHINDEIIEFINPVITKSEGSQIGSEGCLSVPEKTFYVDRPFYVSITAFNRFGEEFSMDFEEFEAVIICHEYDHLDGILYIDKTVPKPEGLDEENDDEDICDIDDDEEIHELLDNIEKHLE